MKKLFIIVLLCVGFGTESSAQEINFSTYAEYPLTVGELDNNDLEFGQIVTGSGPYEVGISNGKVITITGIEYLDVIVEVHADNALFLDGNPGNAGEEQKSIPFTLNAAYANNNGLPNIGQAKFITEISANSFTKRIPILERQHQPPGPPPTPPTNATDLASLEETVYLYLFGSINVGEVDAGFYSGQVTVTINYD